MLSDNSGQFHPNNDDRLSYMEGQSEFGGGASNIALDMHDHAQRREITGAPPVEASAPLPMAKKLSRREQVAQAHGLNMAGSTRDKPASTAQSSSLPPRMATQKSANHGIFLGGAEINRNNVAG
jgi:hypothetical protein